MCSIDQAALRRVAEAIDRLDEERKSADPAQLAAQIAAIWAMVAEMDRLLKDYKYADTARILNEKGFKTGDGLPLTPNGKLDRRALPSPEPGKKTNEFAGPLSATEEALALIWKEVLRLDHIGVHDNFFELGGHSLLAVRLFALLEKRFNKRLPLATLFQAPTIAQLATTIEGDASREPSSLVPIQTIHQGKKFCRSAKAFTMCSCWF